MGASKQSILKWLTFPWARMLPTMYLPRLSLETPASTKQSGRSPYITLNRFEEAPRCSREHNELRLKAIFIEKLHPSIRYSLRTFCGGNKDSSLHNLARHTTSLVKLREDTGALISSTRDEVASLLRASTSYLVQSRTTPVMTITEAEQCSLPSSSKSEQEK